MTSTEAMKCAIMDAVTSPVETPFEAASRALRMQQASYASMPGYDFIPMAWVEYLDESDQVVRLTSHMLKDGTWSEPIIADWKDPL